MVSGAIARSAATRLGDHSRLLGYLTLTRSGATGRRRCYHAYTYCGYTYQERRHWAAEVLALDRALNCKLIFIEVTHI